MGTLKGNVADITAVTTDIGDCAITTAKLANCAVTTGKMALSVGKWVVGNFISGATTFTGTAAFSIIMGFITITANAAGFVTMGTTAVATAIMAISSTAAWSGFSFIGSALNTNRGVVTASQATIIEVSALGSVVISAEASVAGKYGFMYIATP